MIKTTPLYTFEYRKTPVTLPGGVREVTMVN